MAAWRRACRRPARVDAGLATHESALRVASALASIPARALHALRACAAGLIALVICSLAVATMATAAPANSACSGMGYVERVQVVPDSKELVVTGWAASGQGNVFTTQLIVELGTTEVYRGRIERSERSDVARTTGRADWVTSGFSARVRWPSGLTGHQPVSARMRLGNGVELPLVMLNAARAVDLPPTETGPPWPARAALFLAIALPLVALFAAPWVAQVRLARLGAAPVFGAAVALSFALLVTAGWTGSSIALGLNDPPLLQHDGQPWFGKPQAIRSDEWQVITPLALGQLAHRPPFPVVNRQLGADGMNMLVVGTTAMPVAHPSALAKPATWGYIVFDLRRALAWSWWLPFFGCFGAVWLLLRRMFGIDWRLAAGLALTVAASPYSVVFSGWPAYTIFFPAVALLAAHGALRQQRGLNALACGALLGWAAAGFVLVLYPPWQISLAYLFAPLGVAWIATTRRELSCGRAQVVAAAAAVGVAVVVLGSWWLDAADAAAAIKATVYPGQRSLEVGGDADRWFLIKGLLSPITMYRDTAIVWGASDAGSVVLFLVPTAACTVLRWWRLRRVDLLGSVLWVFVAVVLCFMYLGFSADWARLTGWGRATSYRMDAALGMAQVLLFAWLASPMRAAAAGEGVADGYRAAHWVAGSVAALAAVHALVTYRLLPPSVAEVVPASLALLGLCVVGAGAYLLARGRHRRVFALYAALTFAASVPFNPLSIAPAAVAIDPVFERALESVLQQRGAGRGVTVVGGRSRAMLLASIGMPVTHSVFYYPPRTLMASLDPSGAHQALWNRYQRLNFNLESADEALPPGQTYRIDSPRLDEVVITLSATHFDFRLLKGKAVLATAEDTDALSQNPTLDMAQRGSTWTLFTVRP